jgi:hypothetical protein
MVDRPLDRLVIAKLEVQERHLLDGAPITAVERVGTDEVERAGDRRFVAVSEEEQEPVAHSLADPIEEGAGEIRVTPFAAAGIQVKGPHRVPFGGADVAAGKRGELQAFAGGGAFLSDCLAFAACEGGEEFVEIAVAAIVPVILDAVTD